MKTNGILSGSGIEQYSDKKNMQRQSKGHNEKMHKNKNCKKRSIVFLIINIIFVILTILFTAYIIKLNMIPLKYIIVAGLGILLITLLLSVGLISKKKTLRIICAIICIVIVVIYGIAYYYIDKTMGFVDSLLVHVDETEEYYIVAPKNSNINSVKDIQNKTMHIFVNTEEITDVKENIKKEANVVYKEDDDLDKLAVDLINEKIQVALISSSQYSMITEENKEFADKTKKIYTTTHKISAENSASGIKDNNSKQTIQNGVFNIYISGIDTAGNISRVSRSDANILATVNTNTHEVLLTSIPRDYYVTLHSKKSKDKLTHSGIYGINETVTTVEDFMDIEVNYYVRVNFTTLIKLVDVLGGIDVNSNYNFTAENHTYKKGINHLNGESALIFSRERHSFADGDRQRGKNQQKVLEAIIKKCASSKTILTKYTNILDSLSKSFQTNVSQDEISTLVKGQINNMSPWKVTMISLDGTGASKSTYSAGSQLLSVMIPDEKTISKAQQEINRILSNN